MAGDIEPGTLLSNWDRVTGDPTMTEFKRALRKHQAKWRAERGLRESSILPASPTGP